MTEITQKQEEIRDDLLSLFEDNEEELTSYTSQIEKIEDDSFMLFEMKVIAIKNKLVSDVSVSDEELQEKYLQEIELARKSVLEDTENKIKELIAKQGQI